MEYVLLFFSALLLEISSALEGGPHQLYQTSW